MAANRQRQPRYPRPADPIKPRVLGHPADEKVAAVCGAGHITYLPLSYLTDEGLLSKCWCRGKLFRSIANRFVDDEAEVRNHSLIPAPPQPEMVRVDGRPQCDACVVGDHGRCTGVGCFCRTSPVTRQTHMAGLVGRSL